MIRKEEQEFEAGNFTVKLRKNESADLLIKRFMRKMKKEGLLAELMERSAYEKPSVRKRKAAQKRKQVLAKLTKKQEEEFFYLDK